MRIRSSFTAPQFNVGAIGRSYGQSVQAKNAAFSASTAILTGVARLYDTYQQDKTERELQAFRLQSTMGESAFVEQYGAKDRFTAEEVGKFLVEEDIQGSGIKLTEPYMSDNGDVGERPRKDIPAYEVYPKMYKAFMDKSIPLWGEGITNDDARAQTIATTRTVLKTKVLKNHLDAVAQQKRAMRTEVDVNVKHLTDKGNYDLARTMIQSSTVLTPTEKTKKLDALDVREETDLYDNTMAQGDIGRLAQMSKTLALPPEAYAEGGGKLSSPTRRSYKRYIDATVSRLSAEKNATNAARISAARSRITEATAQFKKGHPPDLKYLQDHSAILYASGKPIDMLHLQRLEEAMVQGEAYQFIQMHDSPTSEAKIDQVLADNVGFVRNIPELKANLQQANEAKQQALNHDAVAHAQQFYSIPRFNAANMHVGGPENSLVQAKQTEQFIRTKYNRPNEYLSKLGWDDLRTTYEEQDLQQKMKILQSVSTVMGDKTETFWESGYKHDAGPMVVIGSIANEHPTGARMALQGLDYMKGKHGEPAVVLPKDLDGAARELLSTMFADPEVAAQRLTAVKGAYAYMSYHEDSGLVGEAVNEDLLKRAILTTTKGKIEYGDRVFEAPDLKTNDVQFERKIKNVSATHWDREGGFVDYPSKKVKQDLDDGKLSFDRVGTGKYIIVNSDNEPLRSKLTNQAYIFDYHKQIFTVDQENAQKNIKAYRDSIVDPDARSNRRQKRMDSFMGIGGSL